MNMQAWVHHGGIPITFSLGNPKGSTNQAFTISVTDVRVDPGTNPDSAADGATLMGLLRRLEKQKCFRLRLDMPGMQLSPIEAAPVVGDAMQWSLWTDKQGNYAGNISGSIVCNKEVEPLLDPKASRFTTHVSAPLLDRETVKKAVMDFLGPVLTVAHVNRMVQRTKG